MATAGVRLLEKPQQTALLNEICSYARDHSAFSLPDCDLHIQVIPGDTEGLYGWIAANYLLGGFDLPDQHAHGKGHHTYGFLDMGGASAQIAFAPNATEANKHANDLTLLRMRTLNGQTSEYKVFTTTWLGFGVNQARQRFVEALQDESYTSEDTELLDPCLPSGLKTTLEGVIIAGKKQVEPEDPVLVGIGLFDECLRRTYPLLDKDAPCEDYPCLLHGQHVPAIDFDVNHFVGVSEYWHTTHEVFEMSNKDKAYNFKKYQAMVKDFCSQDWHEIEDGIDAEKWGQKVDEKIAREACFKASWLINVLHDGIGVPRIGIETGTPKLGNNTSHDQLGSSKSKGFLDPFQAVDKIDDVEVSWTLGKMLLYAAGQIPPAVEEALPVGFGSNVGGIPSDFQYAGSSSGYVPIGDDEDDWSDAADELIEKAHSKSSSTFFVFVLILFIVGYVLRKRERRKRFFNGASIFLRRNRRPGSPRKGRSVFNGGKLFGGRSGGLYDRVDDGEAAREFELSDVEMEEHDSSDSSESSRFGHSSGLATPKMNVSSFESNYFEAPAGAANIGLRSGLGLRTESRERLAPHSQSLGGGRRSRTGSPTRLKGGVHDSIRRMMNLKGEPVAKPQVGETGKGIRVAN